MRIRDWSSDVCSSDLEVAAQDGGARLGKLAGEAGEIGAAPEFFEQPVGVGKRFRLLGGGLDGDEDLRHPPFDGAAPGSEAGHHFLQRLRWNHQDGAHPKLDEALPVDQGGVMVGYGGGIESAVGLTGEEKGEE